MDDEKMKSNICSTNARSEKTMIPKEKKINSTNDAQCPATINREPKRRLYTPTF